MIVRASALSSAKPARDELVKISIARPSSVARRARALAAAFCTKAGSSSSSARAKM